MKRLAAFVMCPCAVLFSCSLPTALGQSEEIAPNDYIGDVDFESKSSYWKAGFLSYVYVSPLMDFFSERASAIALDPSDDGSARKSGSNLVTLPSECTEQYIGTAPYETFYVNQISYLPSLATCTNPVVRPDHGHLYVNCWLDLTEGPVTVSYDTLEYEGLKSGTDAVYTVQFLDPLSNNIFHIAPWGNLQPDSDGEYGQDGSVTNPGGAVGWYEGSEFYVWYENASYAEEFKLWMDAQGIPASKRIEYSQPLGWMLGRVSVPFNDVEPTRELCKTFCATAKIMERGQLVDRDPSQAWPSNPLTSHDKVECTALNGASDSDVITYLDQAAKCLGYQQPAAYEIQFPDGLITDLYREAMGSIGVSAEVGGPSNASLSEDQISQVASGFQAALNSFCPTSPSPSTDNETWVVPPRATGNYGEKYYYRALVAQQGFGAEVSSYEFYPTAYRDGDGALQSYVRGDSSSDLVPQEYLLVMDKERLDEASAMWSLTMYYAGPVVPDSTDEEPPAATAALLCCNQNNSCEFENVGCITDIGTKHRNWAGGNGPISYNGKYYVVMSPEAPDDSLKDKVNWLPTPNTTLPSASGGCGTSDDQQATSAVDFNITLRVYNAKVTDSGVEPALSNGWPLPCISLWNSSEGLADACTPAETGCLGDLNEDGTVDQHDLVLVIENWGCLGSCGGDLDGNETVDSVDLALLISSWGECDGE